MNKFSSTAAAFALSMALAIPMATASAQEATTGVEPEGEITPAEQSVTLGEDAGVESAAVETEGEAEGEPENIAPAESTTESAADSETNATPSPTAEEGPADLEPSENIEGDAEESGSPVDGSSSEGTQPEAESSPAPEGESEADAPAAPETPADVTDAAAGAAETSKTSSDNPASTSDPADSTSSESVTDPTTESPADAEEVVETPLEGAVGTPSLAYDAASASVTVRASGVACATGVEFVSACLTSPSGAQTWVRLASEGGQTWSASVTAESLGWEKGTWTVSLIVCDTAWAGVEAGSAACALDFGEAIAVPSLSYDPVSATVTVTAADVACTSGVTFVSARIVSPSGAETWLRLENVEGGSVGGSEGGVWSATVAAADLGWEEGSWYVGLTVCDAAWRGIDAGAATCELTFGEASAYPSLAYDPATGSVTVLASEVTCSTGVEFVSAKLTSPSGAVTWLRLESVGRGDWAVSVPAADLGWEEGSWTVELTVCDAGWRGIDAGAYACALTYGTASAIPSLAYDAATGNVTVTATGVACSTGVEFVSAKLTSPTGAQTWLRLASAGDDAAGDVWSASVAAADLGWEEGAWTVETYVCDEMWRAVEGGRTSSTLSFSTGGETLWTQSGAVAGYVVVHVSGGVVNGASNVAFFAAGLNGANSWHQAVEQPDGSWAVALSEQDLSADSGWVQAVAAANGETHYLSAVPFSIEETETDIDALSTSVTDAEGNAASIVGTALDGTVYVFLPSNANPSSFSLSLVAGTGSASGSGSTATSGSSMVYVSGDLISGFIAHESGDVIDLTDGTFAQDASGSYVLYVKANGYASATRVYVMQSAGLKSLYIVSDDPDEEGREYIEDSEDHSAKASGTMSLVNADGTVVYDGKLKQIKGRGNSTWQGAKKPYQVKLGSSASLVTGDKEDKSKTWVLLANYYDPSLMRNYISYTLAKALGLSDSTDCETVDLYYDGEYRGTYLLSEKVQIGSGRVDITDLEEQNGSLDGEDVADHPTEQGVNSYGNEYQYVTGVKEPSDISGGYLLEIDNGYYESERSWFQSSIGSVVLKSPENSSQDEVRYISEYFQEAVNEGSKTDGNLGRYFDLSSLAKSFLVQTLAKNADYMRYSSTFFYKDAGDGLIYSGPVWDFDTAYGNHESDDEYDYTDPEGFGSEEISFFFHNEQFRTTVQKVFSEVFAPLVESTLLSDDGGTEELGSVDSIAEDLSASEAMNEKIWGFGQAGFSIEPEDTYEENVSNVKTWLTTRYAWMKETITSSSWLEA